MIARVSSNPSSAGRTRADRRDTPLAARLGRRQSKQRRASWGKCALASHVIRRPNEALSGEPLFRLAAAHSGTPVAAINEQPNCNRRDAAPVLFGRGASAPDAVRRLVRLNGKLGSRASNVRSREQCAREDRARRGACSADRPASRTHLESGAHGLRRAAHRAHCIVRQAGWVDGPRREG